MSYTNIRNWKRDVLAERLGVRDGSHDEVTEADMYLTAGKIVRWGVRRGYRVEVISRAIGLSLSEGFSALCYAEGSPRLILEALVEGWTWERIKSSLNKPLNADEPVPRRT